ncbi:MAG: hypothetical protein O2794_00510 [bacterium]|nr:hypothetical protein [bacterium]
MEGSPTFEEDQESTEAEFTIEEGETELSPEGEISLIHEMVLEGEQALRDLAALIEDPDINDDEKRDAQRQVGIVLAGMSEYEELIVELQKPDQEVKSK